MVVGILVVGLYIPQSGSLKGKRRVLQGIKMRIKNKFNVAVAEVGEDGEQDLWQRATLGITAVSNDQRFVNEVLDKVVNTIMNAPEVMVIHRELRFV